MSTFEVIEHEFTPTIVQILTGHFGDDALALLNSSPLLGYLNRKTRAANRGAKARSALSNHYALYVLVEDYIKGGFFDGSAPTPYSQYAGARFSALLQRQRELPFGARFQNHSLNSRLNDEFRKFYPAIERVPIMRDAESQRYWIHEDLLQVVIYRVDGTPQSYNIAQAVLDIIDQYAKVRQATFETFLRTCQQLTHLGQTQLEEAKQFIVQQLGPNVDARIFEVVSYAILKAKFGQQAIWIGDTPDSVIRHFLTLYKTGRTNANDGGIDFVMRPLGRFFQVTEVFDVEKYFLDIDKVHYFPITFVVKSQKPAEDIRSYLREQTLRKYKIERVVERYMDAIEEIITSKNLLDIFDEVVAQGCLQSVMDEIVHQGQMEFSHIGDISQVQR